MAQKLFFTDGRGTKSIDPWHSDGAMWRYNSNPPPMEADELYSRVAAVYRAINFTADTLSNMPFAILKEGGAEVDTSEEYKNEVGFLPYPRQLLRLMVQSFLVTNKAFAFQETKGRAVKNLRYIAPSTIQILTNPVTGDLTGFKRTLHATSQDYMIKGDFCNIVYAFNLNWKNELLPDDQSPFMAMCNAAGIGYYADKYIKDFFERGGIKPTILTFDGVLDKTSMDQVESVWTKVIRGYYKYLGKVFNGKFTPTVIGEGIAELKDQAVYDNALRNIAIAIGMPQDALLQNADSYATAQVHKSTWFSDTLTPLSQAIAEPLNEQVFKRLGYRFEFRPEVADPDMEEERQRITAAEVLFNILNAGNRKDADKAALESLGIDLPQWFTWEEKEPEPMVIAEGQAITRPGEPNPFGNSGKAPKVDAARARVTDGKEEKHYPGGQDHEQQNHAGEGGERDYNLSEIYSYPAFPEYEDDYFSDVDRPPLTIPTIGKYADADEIKQQVRLFTSGLAKKGSYSIAAKDREVLEFALDWVGRVWVIEESNIRGGGEYSYTLSVRRGTAKETLSVRPQKSAPVISVPALREMQNWQDLAFRKLKKAQPLTFEWEARDIPADLADGIRTRLATATDEAGIKAAFEIGGAEPEPVNETKTLADALNNMAAALRQETQVQGE
jgi:hypothetical protein